MENKPNEDTDNSVIEAVEKDQKEFIDPATAGAAVTLFSWFALKAALQGVIGYVATKLFEPMWASWHKEKDESDRDISEKDQKPKS